jgi:DNA-binding transcriptional LysR family regulator
MQLRDIEYFAVVAEHGNVRRASEALGLSPPALSKSLHRLEDSMQAKLVERTPKGVALTPVGVALLAQVQRIRLTLDDVAREAADLTRGRAGHLRVGASQADSELLPAAFAEMLKSESKLTIEVVITDNDVMLPQLRRGELDVVVNSLPARAPEGLDCEPLYEDGWVIYAAAHHRLAKAKRVSLSDLAQERWALGSPNIRSTQILQHVFEEAGLPPLRIALDARSGRLRLQTCAQTDLLGLSSMQFLQPALKRFRLKVIPVKELALHRTVYAIYRREAYLSPAARRLIKILKSRPRTSSFD